MVDFAIATVGLVMLVLAGDALVRGAVNVSLRLGVPALIVSLTIVSVGTSAPELLVSFSAAYEGVPGIALGNVIGSNTANVLLVLGVPALLFGLATRDCDARGSYVHMLIASVAFTALCATGLITFWMGLALITAFMAFMIYAGWLATRARAPGAEVDEEEVEGADAGMSWRKISLFLALGLIGLPIGAELLVTSATRIAQSFDVSDAVIGLTLVAVGTSLPELATTISAAYRRQADVAIGNVIGSNLANVLLIIGATAIFVPIPVPEDVLMHDVSVMLIASFVMLPFVFARTNMTRFWGATFTFGYVAYVVSLFV